MSKDIGWNFAAPSYGIIPPNPLAFEFFNRSTSILIAEVRIALEPWKRISRVEVAGANQDGSSALSLPIKVAFAFYTGEVF